IDEVCPDPKAGCAPLRNTRQSALTLGSPPEALVGSPSNDQLVVVSGASGSRPGSVIVVPVPAPTAGGSGGPSPAALSTPTVTLSLPPTTSGAPATVGPSGTSAAPTPGASPASPTGSAGPTPQPTPVGAHSIAEGVVVVGETRYSPDGTWLAFSPEP